MEGVGRRSLSAPDAEKPAPGRIRSYRSSSPRLRLLSMKVPYDRLVLPFGFVVALAAFVYWTALGYQRFAAWTPEGLFRAVFALGAVLLLAGVLRLARHVTERDGL